MAGRDSFAEGLFVMAVSLANLTLHAVAVYGVLETFLGHADKDLGVGCWVFGVGCWVLGVGCWVLGVGCWVLGDGYYFVDGT